MGGPYTNGVCNATATMSNLTVCAFRMDGGLFHAGDAANTLTCVGFSPDGRIVGVGSMDESVSLFDLRSVRSRVFRVS